MDLSAIAAINGLGGMTAPGSVQQAGSLTGSLTDAKEEKVKGNLFGALLENAVSNIRTTNSYLSDMEDEEVRFMLGETDNPHDLTIALGKASSALQYTVAIRDRLLDAYKELMQMQI